MANKLKDLLVTKIDFVDAGANPEANIVLFKRKPEGAAAEKKPQTAGGFFRSVGKWRERRRSRFSGLMAGI